jgi:hypothetical protein
MENKSMIDFFTDKIKKQEVFSFIKLGDGEQNCMAGAEGANCDGSKYGPALAKKLMDSFEYFAEKDEVYVPLFKEQAYYNTFLHRPDNDLTKLRNFYAAIREDKRHKVFVGPPILAIVAKLLKATQVMVPEQDGFKAYDEIEQKVIKALVGQESSIVLFSFGMMSKPLIRKVLLLGNNTCIDLGSAWDPIVKQTRTNQISQKEMLELYGDWILEIAFV